MLWLGPGATVLSGLIVPRPVRERRSGHVGVASARNVGEKALPPRLMSIRLLDMPDLGMARSNRPAGVEWSKRWKARV